MYEPAAVSSAASISPDTRKPTQLDELWIAGTTVNAAAVTRVISTSTRSRRRIASENSPTARVTGTDETANTTTPMAVTATGCWPAPPQRRGAGQPDDQHQPPDQRSLVPADERLGERRRPRRRR